MSNSSKKLQKSESKPNSVDVIPTILKILGLDPKAEGKIIEEVFEKYR